MAYAEIYNAQASEDLKVHPTQLRNWVKAFSNDRQHALIAVEWHGLAGRARFSFR